MGTPSVSIMLHEIAKLLHYAKVQDAVMIRVGTSGGVGIKPGTVVVSKDVCCNSTTTPNLTFPKVVNGLLQPEYNLDILGKTVSRPSVLDPTLAEAIIKATPKGIDVSRP